MECFVGGSVVGGGARREVAVCGKRGDAARLHQSVAPRRVGSVVMAAVDEAQVDAELAPLNMYVRSQQVKQVVADNRLHEKDTGSPEAQISKLTVKIQMLTEHAKQNPKDHSSTRGLIAMVAQRKRLLKYLRAEDPARFDKIVESLGLRISQAMLSKY
ncbi:30S ribosomal protein S15 [Porphyridium purpureum]|uniref:30S ribosomal protein S15 n=1 Tax=Porphyridium purpureum TaxID=35688 RepID=A0A5J4Z374_PORPP|nr:30S ribosomal protein S15 [Porphyridium purpureum]|eukprot:POR3372..scf295_1